MSSPIPRITPPAPSPVPNSSGPIAKPRRRRRVKLLVGIGVCVLFGVAAAPTIVAKTGLRNRIAQQAAIDVNGTLAVGGASLGWLSAVELRDVTLTDPQGRVLARIPKVTSSKSLFGLLLNRTDLGEITLHQPAVEVVCEPNRSNLEEAFRNYLDDTKPPSSPTRPQVRVCVTGGTFTLLDAVNGTSGEFRNVTATIHCPATRSEPVTITLSADSPGRVEAEIVAAETGRLRLTATDFALETLAPLLRRFQANFKAAGSLTADLTAKWDSTTTTLEGQLGAKTLALSDPSFNGDTLRFASVEFPVKLVVSDRTIQIERADLTSEIGSISVNGTFMPDEPFDRFLERPGAKLDANIDLAKLATTLPRLLRIRAGTELREGQLAVKVESKPTPAGTTWAGTVSTSALKAVRNGREVKWEEPLSVEFAGQYRPGELPVFDKLICRSDFIAIQAEVKPDSVRAAANVYLDRLATRLADFVDLGDTKLDGRGSASLVFRRTADNSYTLDGLLELKQFAFVNPGGKDLQEPQLTLRVTGSGKAPNGGPTSISAANATITTGDDELRLTLIEPIADAKELTSGKLDAKLTGDLGRWWARVGTFLRLPKHYILGGMATARGTIRFSQNNIAVNRLSLSLVNARFRGAGLDLEEPKMDAIADLTIERKTRTVAFERFTINSNPLTVTDGRLVITAPEQSEVIVEGGGPANVGLNRLGRTLKLYVNPTGADSLRGRGTGSIHFRYSAGVTTFGGTLDIVNFSYGLPTAPDWSEPTLRLETEGSFVESTDTLRFNAARIERPGLAIDSAIVLANLGTTADLNLTGTLSTDFAKLSPKLREHLGGGFVGKGKGNAPISLSGSFSPSPKPGVKAMPGPLAAMNGELRFGWDSLHAYGFDVGRGALHGKLTEGICRVNPIAATFGGGKVTVQPTLFFNAQPSRVTFAKGKIVEHAKLTPAVCADALGYALPALARTGKAEGELSIVLGENSIPIDKASGALVKGQIIIHKATVAPGPVIGEVAKLLGASNIAMTITNETTVPIRVENGNVYHHGFAVQFGGHTIITSGSVGFDGKLNLVADVPIPNGLLKNAPLAAKALANKRVKVPITGTLAKPTLDPKLFQAAIAKLAQEAAKDLGKELLDKELDKLFPGMPGRKK